MKSEIRNTSSTVDSWAARWLAEASSSLRGSYAGRAYTVRSIRTGDPSKNGRASGYAPQVPHHYKPDDGIPAEADDFSANGVATQFTTQDSGTAAAVVETASLLSLGAGSGAGTASPAAQSMTVTTDKADYAPGSTATFIVAGVNSGSSVAFQIADLASDPGINGIADVYAPFSVTDGGTGDADGLANGAVVAQWQVPADGSATGAVLQLTATSDSQTAITTFSDAPNKIVSENLNAGTPKSVWAIHGSIANQGNSQIEGFATQISTNAGQTVSFKIDTASSGYTLDIYRLGYYGGNGARSSRPCTTVERTISRTRSSMTRPTPSTPETGRLRIHGQSPALPCRGSTSPS